MDEPVVYLLPAADFLDGPLLPEPVDERVLAYWRYGERCLDPGALATVASVE